jgi:hypothetical protein
VIDFYRKLSRIKQWVQLIQVVLSWEPSQWTDRPAHPLAAGMGGVGRISRRRKIFHPLFVREDISFDSEVVIFDTL